MAPDKKQIVNIKRNDRILPRPASINSIIQFFTVKEQFPIFFLMRQTHKKRLKGEHWLKESDNPD